MVFLSESHMNNAKAIEVKNKLGFDLVHIVESDGRSGGLVMFYILANEVVLNFSSPNFIDGFVMDGNYVAWLFTGFYGEPSWELKHQSWTAIRDLNKNANGPWMILGDFSEILVSSEKEGGNVRTNQYMQNFRDCIEECDLQEIMYLGDPYTWSRGFIRERLDRALCNDAWASKFPYAVVIHEHHVHSDHRPLVLDTNYFEAAMT